MERLYKTDIYGIVNLIFDVLFAICEGDANSICQQKLTLKNTFGTLILWRAHCLFFFWFLTAIFIAELIFYLQKKFLKNDYIIFGTAIMFFIVGYIILHVFKIALPYDFELGLMANLFVTSGFMCKKHKIVNKLKDNNRFIIGGLATIIFVGAVYTNFSYFGRRAPSFLFGDFLNPLLYIVGAYAGSIIVIIISLKFQEVKILSLVGTVSLTIYCFQGITNKIIFLMIDKINDGIIGELILFGLTLISVGIIAYIGWIIDKRKKI